MKKDFTSILLLFLSLAVGNIVKAEFLPTNVGPAVINKDNVNQLKNYNIEKNIIETTEVDIEKEQKAKEELENKKKKLSKGI